MLEQCTTAPSDSWNIWREELADRSYKYSVRKGEVVLIATSCSHATVLLDRLSSMTMDDNCLDLVVNHR